MGDTQRQSESSVLRQWISVRILNRVQNDARRSAFQVTGGVPPIVIPVKAGIQGRAAEYFQPCMKFPLNLAGLIPQKPGFNKSPFDKGGFRGIFTAAAQKLLRPAARVKEIPPDPPFSKGGTVPPDSLFSKEGTAPSASPLNTEGNACKSTPLKPTAEIFHWVSFLSSNRPIRGRRPAGFKNDRLFAASIGKNIPPAFHSFLHTVFSLCGHCFHCCRMVRA